MLKELLSSSSFWLAATLGIYLALAKLQARLKSPLLNPLFLSTVILIIILINLDLPYESYMEGGRYIQIFVTPATVSLAIKLYKNFDYFKRYVKAIVTGIMVGVLAHTAIVAIASLIFNYDYQIAATLYPKSITTAIAVDVSATMGGLPSLTVALVVFTGVVGGIIAAPIFKACRIDDPVAQGIALGMSAHAVGTSKAIELGDLQGSMSSLALIFTGIITTLIAPAVQAIFMAIL